MNLPRKNNNKAGQMPADAETEENAGAPVSEEAGLVVIKGRKNARQIVHSLAKWVSGIVASVLLILFMTPELPDYVFAAEGGEEIRARDIVKEHENAKIGIVYPENEEKWAYSESVRLSEKIDSAYDIATEVVSDALYSDDNDYTLTVSVGYTSFFKKPYFTEFMRLGRNGYEISHLENGDGKTWLVSILAFEGGACRQAADRFLSFFLSKNRLFNSSGSLYVSVTDESTKGQFVNFTDDDGFSYLTVSRPGADEASLNAFSAIIDSEKPDFVIINGLLTAGCSDRKELTGAWSPVMELLSAKSLKFTAVPDADDAADPVNLSILYEILGDSGCYVNAVTDERHVFPLFVSGSSGLPYGMIMLKSTQCSDEDISGIIGMLVSPVLRSSAVLHCALVSPVIPEGASQAMKNGIPDSMKIYGEIPQPAVSDGLPEQIAPSEFIGLAGANCIGTVNGGNTAYGFCGSIDFTAEGVGGRYELNNSLRGGMIAGFLPDGTVSRFGYVRAADLGAVKR